MPPVIVTPLMAFQQSGVNVLYAKGCDVNSTDTSMIPAAVAAAKQVHKRYIYS
jgi:hypothetical protein